MHRVTHDDLAVKTTWKRLTGDLTDATKKYDAMSKSARTFVDGMTYEELHKSTDPCSIGEDHGLSTLWMVQTCCTKSLQPM